MKSFNMEERGRERSFYIYKLEKLFNFPPVLKWRELKKPSVKCFHFISQISEIEAMAEEASASETSVREVKGTLETQNSEEATIQSIPLGGTESTCNNVDGDNDNGAETSATTSSEGDREKSLELADELTEKGSKALKDGDFFDATECFSRALEIRLGF